METIKVNIGGSEYSLTGENKNLLNDAANFVNQKLNEIKTNYNVKLSNDTLSVLTALNMAEIYLNLEKNTDKELNAINSELAKMVQQMKEILK